MTFLGQSLIAWYNLHRRSMPWRAPVGEYPEPYHVLLSEMMLQQTTVATVVPYFTAFIKRWPTFVDLANAPLDDILHAWQGLGYYRRAHFLYQCASFVVNHYDGRLPNNEKALRSLPGIGSYTAAAIIAIAFGGQSLPMDGNIKRIVARLLALEQSPQIADSALYQRLVDPTYPPGDIAQALMDLGALICRPRRPACVICPLASSCAAWKIGKPEAYPTPRIKKALSRRFGIAFWLERYDGAIALRQRPSGGLLGGMMEFPSTPWRESAWTTQEAVNHAPASCDWEPRSGEIQHVFTHFHLTLRLWYGQVDTMYGPADIRWVQPHHFHKQALPTLMHKIADLALAASPDLIHSHHG